MARMRQVLPTYTPFAKAAMGNMGEALKSRDSNQREKEKNELASLAYMGDPEALQALAEVDPKLAMQVEDQSGQRSARERQAEAHETAQMTAQSNLDTASLGRIQKYDQVMGNMFESVGAFDTYEEAKNYADQEGARLNELYGDLPGYKPVQELTPEAFSAAKAQADAELKKKGWTRSGSTEVMQYTDPETGEQYMSRVQPFTNERGQVMAQFVTGADGKPMRAGTQYDAGLTEDLAGAKERGKTLEEIDLADDVAFAKLSADAKTQLGPARKRARATLKVVDEIANHPGLKYAVGVGWLNPAKYAPGTDARDFMVQAQQARGKIFQEAYETLRGGGQITEIEAAKAEQAIARMDESQSVEAYLAALRDFQDSVREGYQLLLDQASGKMAEAALGDDIETTMALDAGAAGSSQAAPLVINRGDPKPPPGTWVKAPNGKVFKVPG